MDQLSWWGLHTHCLESKIACCHRQLKNQIATTYVYSFCISWKRTFPCAGLAKEGTLAGERNQVKPDNAVQCDRHNLVPAFLKP